MCFQYVWPLFWYRVIIHFTYLGLLGDLSEDLTIILHSQLFSFLFKKCLSCSCESFLLTLILYHVTLSFSHLTFSPSFLPYTHNTHIHTHTQLPNCLSPSLSHVCHWGHSLGFLSSSNTAALHHDCNSSSACNSKPRVTRVIRLPPHHDNGTTVNNHLVTRSGTCLHV